MIYEVAIESTCWRRNVLVIRSTRNCSWLGLSESNKSSDSSINLVHLNGQSLVEWALDDRVPICRLRGLSTLLPRHQATGGMAASRRPMVFPDADRSNAKRSPLIRNCAVGHLKIYNFTTTIFTSYTKISNKRDSKETSRSLRLLKYLLLATKVSASSGLFQIWS